MEEKVDILQPPLFTVSGKIKTRQQAYQDGDWIGTFNLWIVSDDPVPSVIYQQRSPESTWAPNLLDVTAGGHYQAGEQLTDGLREVDEELGKQYSISDVVYLGRKMYVGFNTDGTSHNNIVDVYLIEDNSPLSSYRLEEAEVYALCKCPVSELLKAHENENYKFKTIALTAEGKEVEIEVGKKSFPENWDNYHYKMAILADRYFKDEKNLLY